MNSITTLSPKQLRRAADIQERIESLQKELSHILAVTPQPAAVAAPKKRRMSAAGRARIAAAARARWARVKGTAGKRGPKAGRKVSAAAIANIPAGVRKSMAGVKSISTAPKRRKMSAAGRARLSAMAKARWAKAKAQGKSAL